MRTSTSLMAGLLLGMALSTVVMADPPHGKGKPDKQEKHAGKGKSHDRGRNAPLVVVTLTAPEARRIALSHQAIGYSALPPGIRKNLARGKPLPPGIAKRGVPGPVLAQLPQYPGYEWQVAGSDLLLISLATAVVADVLNGVFD